MGTPGAGYKPPRPITYQQLGIKRMFDAREPSGDPETASLIRNAYPVDPFTTRAIVGRPGVWWLGSGTVGGGGTGLGQMGFQFKRLDGTAYTVLIINGLMYKINWTTNTLTSVALPGWLTFQTVGKIYGVVLADKLIISDGVRKPVSWDGTNFVDLTECPILFGQPVVHYAKLTGIVAANPVQIVWSEENDPTVGYLGTNAVTGDPYDNQWVLGQTSQDRLYVLMAIEDALYFSRARSWSMITGANEDDYRSTGNREAVSNTIGCVLPSACIFRNGEIWFQDYDGHFHVMAMGGQPQPIGKPYRENIAVADKDPPATTGGRANLCSMVDWSSVPLVMATVAIPNTDPGGPWDWRYRILTWHPDTKEAMGVWDLPPNVEPTHLCAAYNLNELERVIIALDEHARVLIFGTPQNGPWQDTTPTGNAAIVHEVHGAELGWDSTQEKDWESITALFHGTVLTGANTSLGYVSQRRLVSVPQLVQNQAALSAAAEIRRKVGIKNQSRWLRPIVIHNALNEQFRFEGFEVGAYAIANAPKVA